MNAIEKVFERAGQPVKGLLDLDKLDMSDPVALTSLNNMINTKVTISSAISLVTVQYERKDIGEIVKFSHHAVKTINNDPIKMQTYLKEVYDIDVELNEFKIAGSVLTMLPSCYLYVGKAKIVGNNDPMLFNVTDSTYCKIRTVLESSSFKGLYQVLVENIPNFKSIDVGNVEDLFSFEVKELVITITLMDHTKIKFINGAIDG